MEHNQRTRYPLRCPLCGTSMVGEKADAEAQDFDRHRCLSCGTVVETGGDSGDDE